MANAAHSIALKDAPTIGLTRAEVSQMTAPGISGLLRAFLAINETLVNEVNRPRHTDIDDEVLDPLWQWSGHCIDLILEVIKVGDWSTPEDIELVAWVVIQANASFEGELQAITALAADYAERHYRAEFRAKQQASNCRRSPSRH